MTTARRQFDNHQFAFNLRYIQTVEKGRLDKVDENRICALIVGFENLGPRGGLVTVGQANGNEILKLAGKMIRIVLCARRVMNGQTLALLRDMTERLTELLEDGNP